ncbi:Hypothetical predicted protein [Paramuricea clavata]|uniref:Uncharacterized protein n=1 Tax=Paramuricea clavata TaxID=317549 RepID=A0A6S7GX83_PARCT|nr:Hypothetical predicted protein [Paramuricea clavata]
MNIHTVLVNCIIAFLSGRCQRVKEDVHLVGLMSRRVYQGTKLGPLLFPILINDFKPTNDITKFVDDSSIVEVVLQNTISKLDQTLSKTSEWVDRNYIMELNGKKNKGIKDYIFRP